MRSKLGLFSRVRGALDRGALEREAASASGAATADPATTATQGCPHSDDCPMFALFTHAGNLAVWQINYCSGDFSRCARFKLSCANRPVPMDLMPNGARLARK